MWSFPIPVHKWPLYHTAVEMRWGRRLCWRQWRKELWWVKSLTVSLATSLGLMHFIEKGWCYLSFYKYIEILKIESTPKTPFDPESKDSVLLGLEEYNWIFDMGLSTWVQNVEDKVESLSNDRSWFIWDQANIWCRKLGEGREGPEVKIDRRLLRTDFLCPVFK